MKQHFSFNCTAKLDDVTAPKTKIVTETYLSSGDLKSSNERVQTDKRQISKQAVPQTCQSICD